MKKTLLNLLLTGVLSASYSNAKAQYIIGHKKEIEKEGPHLNYWKFVDKDNGFVYEERKAKEIPNYEKSLLEKILKESLMYNKINSINYPIYLSIGKPGNYEIAGAETLTDQDNKFSEILIGEYLFENNSERLGKELKYFNIPKEYFIKSILTHESVHAYFNSKYGNDGPYKGYTEECFCWAMQCIEMIDDNLGNSGYFNDTKIGVIHGLGIKNFKDKENNIIVNKENIKKAVKFKISEEDYNFLFSDL